MTVVYTLPDGEDGPIAYATKAEAVREAREWAAYSGSDVEVIRCELAHLPTRALAVALICGRGWAASQEVVFTAKPKPNSDGPSA